MASGKKVPAGVLGILLGGLGVHKFYLGYTKEGACQVESKRSGRTLVISDDLRLDAKSIWIQDRAVDSEGNYVYGHKGGIPHKLQKVRPFTCWAAAPS